MPQNPAPSDSSRRMGGAASRFAVLLFSDIVGSSESKARHGVPAYSEALGTHNGHFERLARECHIRILDNMGDGYFAEAGSVSEAVRFALLFQDALRDGPWKEVRLTARVGIHAGEVGVFDAEGGSGVVGPAADLAARVMSLAVGGQILLTRLPFDEARHFIREHPPAVTKTMPPLRWIGHGAYLFKGSVAPVDVFEVGAEGLAPFVTPAGDAKAKRAVTPDEPDDASSTQTLPRSPASSRSNTFMLALCLAAALLISLAIEQAPWGTDIAKRVASQLRVALPAESQLRARELLVVDITQIKQEPSGHPLAPGEMEPSLATPRPKLAEIIGAITELKPRAIAVDVDFSALDDGRPGTPSDGSFFENILRMSEEKQVPIFLGVDRQRWRGSESWLGSERFSRMAAGIRVPEAPDTNRYYVRWLRGDGANRALPNLSLALAGRANQAGFDEQKAPLNWALRRNHPRQERRENPGELGGVMSWALVDYSALTLLEAGRLSVVSPGTMLENRQKFKGRLILIGDAEGPQPHDHFNIGDTNREPLAGVYLHACAALTEMSQLLELTVAGRLALYGVVNLVIIGIFSAAQWIARGQGGGISVAAMSLLAAVGSLLVAVALIRYAQLTWTDFTAVWLGLALYLYLRNRGSSSQRLRRPKPAAIQRSLSLAVAAAILSGCATKEPVSEPHTAAVASSVSSRNAATAARAPQSAALLADASPAPPPPVKDQNPPPGQTRPGGRNAGIRVKARANDDNAAGSLAESSRDSENTFMGKIAGVFSPSLMPGENAAVFGATDGIVGASIAGAAGLSGVESLAVGAAAGAVASGITYVVAEHRASERQRRIAEQRAHAYVGRVASRKTGTTSKKESRYIAVDTVKDARTSPKAKKSVMIYDRRSKKFVGNTVYDVEKTPGVGSTVKFDTYSAEYVGSGG